jgi:hypothetical protein
VRDAVRLSVRERGVELTLETRGARHSETILASLREAGYGIESLEGAVSP